MGPGVPSPPSPGRRIDGQSTLPRSGTVPRPTVWAASRGGARVAAGRADRRAPSSPLHGCRRWNDWGCGAQSVDGLVHGHPLAFGWVGGTGRSNLGPAHAFSCFSTFQRSLSRDIPLQQRSTWPAEQVAAASARKRVGLVVDGAGDAPRDSERAWPGVASDEQSAVGWAPSRRPSGVGGRPSPGRAITSEQNRPSNPVRGSSAPRFGLRAARGLAIERRAGCRRRRARPLGRWPCTGLAIETRAWRCRQRRFTEETRGER